jgi:serine/threonine protein kinase
LFERVRALAHGTRGLSELHALGVVHRDVKPAKILVHETGGRLNDLGIAEEDFIAKGAIPTGSIGFMAPEVALGHHASPQSDLFSVGATLHLMLTGSRCFRTFSARTFCRPCGMCRPRGRSFRGPALPRTSGRCARLPCRGSGARPESAESVADRMEDALDRECAGGDA